MENLYFNDADGRKPPRLSSVEVENPEKLAHDCMDFLCQHLVMADPQKAFFAQNISSHLAYITSAIKKVAPETGQVYISDHEIKWMKEILEIEAFQPADSTHSNYVENKSVEHSTFSVDATEFESFYEKIKDVKNPSIFFISHVSRLTGEIAPIKEIFDLIKSNNPESILIVDGGQAIGALDHINVNEMCDVYIGLSYKFLGAEPSLGIAFMSDDFYGKYIQDLNNYPDFDCKRHAKDLLSLSENLKNPLYLEDYSSYIKSLKEYAVEKIINLDNKILFNPDNQVPNFLTLNFGSREKNEEFIRQLEKQGVFVSNNTGYSIIEPKVPLVRLGLSVRITKTDIDRLVEIIKKEAPRV